MSYDVSARQMVLNVRGVQIVGDLCIQTPLTDAEREEYNERAGIMEFCGGATRADAEYRAMEIQLAKRRAAK